MSHPSEFTNRELFEELVKLAFGRLTIDANQMSLRYDSKVATFPKTFFYERCRKHPETPINALAVERILVLYREALAGDTRYDPAIIAGHLIHVLESCGSLSFSSLFFTLGEDASVRAEKANVLYCLLETLLLQVVDRESVERRAVAAALQARYAEWESFDSGATGDAGQDGFNHGVLNVFFRLEDVGYPKRIASVERQLDVVGFHSFTWTNAYFESLTKLLANPDVAVRVSLLDPASDLLPIYASIFRIKSKELKTLVWSAVDKWRTIYELALSYRSEVGTLDIFFNHAFPAKSMYRLDDTIIVVPAPNVPPMVRYVSYECVNDPAIKDSAFGVHENEISRLMEDSTLLWSSGRDMLE